MQDDDEDEMEFEEAPKKGKKKKKDDDGMEGFADYEQFAHLLEDGVEEEQDRRKGQQHLKKRR